MIDLSIVEYVNDLLVDNLNAKLLLKPLVDMAEEEGKEDAQASRLNNREERWAGQSKAGQSEKTGLPLNSALFGVQGSRQ